jgi:hypothetical protein
MMDGKKFKRGLTYRVFFTGLVIFTGVGVGYGWVMKRMETSLGMLTDPLYATPGGMEAISKIIFDARQRAWMDLSILLAGLVLIGILFRISSGRGFHKHIQVSGKIDKKTSLDSGKPVFAKEKTGHAVDKTRDRVLYTHLLGDFQRQGQWVDFLQENLDLYEDAQIGAAVRNIHGNCKKVLLSHIRLKPILKEDQGEEITLDAEFSRENIKLVGNVHGKPPFKGIVRHQGWAVEKLDIPDFSGDRNTDVLTPAEVEIL